MSRDDASGATGPAGAPRARTLGWLALLFGGLGVADAIRFVRAALRPAPLVAGDWLTLAFATVLLLAATMYLQQRRRLVAGQREAGASNTGRPST